MGIKYASGKFSKAFCDRCGRKVYLRDLRTLVIKTKNTNIKVCCDCFDPDHPQLQLGMYPVNDPQAVKDPRPDTSYVQSGLNVDGVPSGGSRDLQWGWAPVGGSSAFDSVLTPNYLVAKTYVGSVTVTLS